MWVDFATAGSGRSMARALMAVLVLTTSAAVLICAWRYGFGAPMAAAITGLGTTLAGVWGLSKSKWRSDATCDKAQEPRAEDKEQ